jgi:hypothetical protein
VDAPSDGEAEAEADAATEEAGVPANLFDLWPATSTSTNDAGPEERDEPDAGP